MVAFIAAVVGLLAGLLIGWRVWGRARLDAGRQLKENLNKLATGEFETRMVNKIRSRDYDSLMDAFNEMARNLEQQFVNLSNERDVLRHILRAMTTGVVYVSNRGRITMVNAAAERMFKRPEEQWLGHEHWTVFRQYQLGAYIDETSLNGVGAHKEIQLKDGQILDVQLIPVNSPSSAFFGAQTSDVLVICNDVSEFYRLERMRTEFVANVSHELKTPVAAIRGFAETLLENEVDNPDVHRTFLQTIYDEAYRMGNLVSDLLELSRLEGTQQAVQPDKVQLGEVVDSAVSRVRQAAAKRSILLNIKDTKMTVWADEDKLLQVLLNLLTNAINYTPEGGSVTLWCEALAEDVRVHVQDTGIGISPENQLRVFERFYRVNRDRSRSTGGTGLGLAIVKHIIGAHGGEVGVDSRSGEGSDFWFTLPRLGTSDKAKE
ncbi:two-component system histidine kinase PnpS [Alicyclobacillus sp. SO9]|uniref:two-component system histidine kinase PnpS n=1 Tax=Alicyclobacillus sp. SO9 TaxID=2665646 RepID=UPI0018E7377C|nr:HAMP domain-containing sensor histidine kinase [Alicyclobacillus sp. SO9]QQE78125.1 PAS domain-containing protein [Alicyclobacillus sp. SO9]